MLKPYFSIAHRNDYSIKEMIEEMKFIAEHYSSKKSGFGVAKISKAKEADIRDMAINALRAIESIDDDYEYVKSWFVNLRKYAEKITGLSSDAINFYSLDEKID